MTQQNRTFDVQAIELPANFKKVFDYIANPRNLVFWTSAFKEADENSALLKTPNGELKIGLQTDARESGTIDWHMTMPDGAIGKAFSRVMALPNGHTLYSFVLLAPPGPIEELEGTFEEQKRILAEELRNLERILTQ